MEDYEAWLKSNFDTEEWLHNLKSGSSLKLQQVTEPGTTDLIYCNFAASNVRPYTTVIFRQAAINSIHGLSLPGMIATIRLVLEFLS